MMRKIKSIILSIIFVLVLVLCMSLSVFASDADDPIGRSYAKVQYNLQELVTTDSQGE